MLLLNLMKKYFHKYNDYIVEIESKIPKTSHTYVWVENPNEQNIFRNKKPDDPY